MTAKKSFEIIKYALRADEAGSALGAPAVLSACLDAGWIRPVIHRHKLLLFDKGDVAGCWLRIRNGETPFGIDSVPGGIQSKPRGSKALPASQSIKETA